MKDNQNLKQRALSGVMWKFSEKAGMQLVQFVIQIVLARLLMPEDYGIIGLLTIFITVFDVLIQQGLTTGLIQKQDIDELDYSSVFYANLLLAFSIYGILYVSAPWISAFYNEEILTKVLRVLSLNVIIGSFCAVQTAIMSRELDFKKGFLGGLANILTQGVVGIILACYGFRVWSLVFSKLAGILVGAIVLCITIKWYPKKMFSITRIKELFSYSSKVLGTNLLNTIFNNIHSLIIGKYFTSADLGFYQRGQQIPQVLITVVDGSMNEVLYPTLSILQDNMARLKSALRRSMKTSMFFTLPVMFGLIAIAKPLTIVLLTGRWLPSVPFMQLACIICVFWPLSARTHALNAIGLSNVTFKLSIVSKTLTVLFIVICVRFGIYAIMIGTICNSCITLWITSYYVNKYIGYSLKELLLDIYRPFILSVLLMVVVMAVGAMGFNTYLELVLQIIIGVLIYVMGAILLKIDSLDYLLGFFRKHQ